MAPKKKTKVKQVTREKLREWCDDLEVQWTNNNEIVFRQLVALSELHSNFQGVNWTLNEREVTPHKWLRWVTERYVPPEGVLLPSGELRDERRIANLAGYQRRRERISIMRGYGRGDCLSHRLGC